MHVRGIYARKFYWQLNLSNIGLQIDQYMQSVLDLKTNS